MTEKIKVNLFTTELEPVGEYFAPVVPREGEHLNWDDELYEVKTVMWEGLPELPAVQVRLKQ
jgi:hypothetical protein